MYFIIFVASYSNCRVLFFPQAKKFRAFWGSRAELRRFKDGNISETAGMFHFFIILVLYFELRVNLSGGCNIIPRTYRCVYGIFNVPIEMVEQCGSVRVGRDT